MNGNDDFYRTLLDNIQDGVYFVDLDRRVTLWNKGAERLSGYSRDEIIGKRCQDNILVHVDERGKNLCRTGCPLADTLNDSAIHAADVYLHHKNGHRVPIFVQVSPIKDEDNKIIGAIEVFRNNASEREDRSLIDELKKAALLDALTGLPNRRYIEMKVHSSFEELKRHSIRFGVFFADIDHFKKVNDTRGHKAGDVVLGMIARTLQKNVRSSDMVGRWGGEEFIGIITHVNEAQLKNLAEKLRIMVEQSFIEVDGKNLNVTVTMGITMATISDTLETLAERADQCLYKGKQSGRNCVIFD